MSEQECMYGVKELESIIRRIESGNCSEEQKNDFNKLFLLGLYALERSNV